MDQTTRIDFLAGSIHVLPGPVIHFELRIELGYSDLRSYLKACEVFASNLSLDNGRFKIVVDASAFASSSEDALEQLAAFIGKQSGRTGSLFVVPANVGTRIALEEKLNAYAEMVDKSLWFANTGQALEKANSLLGVGRE